MEGMRRAMVPEVFFCTLCEIEIRWLHEDGKLDDMCIGCRTTVERENEHEALVQVIVDDCETLLGDAPAGRGRLWKIEALGRLLGLPAHEQGKSAAEEAARQLGMLAPS